MVAAECQCESEGRSDREISRLAAGEVGKQEMRRGRRDDDKLSLFCAL